MIEYGHKPKGNAARYLEFIWYNDGYTPSGARERVLPFGSSQIIINLEGKRFRHFEDTGRQREYDPAVLTGIHTHSVFLDSYSRTSTMGVVLRPGAVSSLFGIPARKFRNTVVSLSAITDVDFAELRQRLAEVHSPGGKCRYLETFIIRLLDRSFIPNPVIIYAASRIEGRHGIQSISEVVDETGYSRRWFSEAFRDIMGISPKKYARLCRFQHALQVIHKGNTPDWYDIMATCGYFDQSHFIHDFKSLAGISPSEYHENRSTAVNHLPV